MREHKLVGEPGAIHCLMCGAHEIVEIAEACQVIIEDDDDATDQLFTPSEPLGEKE